MDYEYVATAPIDHDGVRAYNVGDPVPADNVKTHGYDKDGLVKSAVEAPPTPAAAPKPSAKDGKS